MGQPNSSTKRIAVAGLDSPGDAQRPIADIDANGIHAGNCTRMADKINLVPVRSIGEAAGLVTRKQRPRRGARLDRSRSSPTHRDDFPVWNTTAAEKRWGTSFLRGRAIAQQTGPKGTRAVPARGQGHALDRLRSSSIVKPVHPGGQHYNNNGSTGGRSLTGAPDTVAIIGVQIGPGRAQLRM
jgi:hypothetical protein